jgi:UDP-galactopyranose mutase
MIYDYLIVGAGFSGSVFAERIASQLNKKVLIVEKRSHIGGNAYDLYNEHGILIHKYGPHWFHTNNKRVFDYLSQFTEWRFHEHRVKSSINGNLYPFLVNRDTLNLLYNLDLKTEKEAEDYFSSVRKDIPNPENSEEYVLSLIGEDLFNKFYRGYTFKHWGLEAKELSPAVTARIPVRTNTDDRYFTDKYQGIPLNGYTVMFNNMLASRNIEVLLNTSYKEIIDPVKFNKMIYTGPADEFFDFIYGSLPYRSLKFEHETLDTEYYQECQQVNYSNENDFTRIIEWKHATGQKHPRTTITKEYALDAEEGMDKYYPVPHHNSSSLFNKYKRERDKLGSVIFCGRLADYRYYNMDQVTARALNIFEKKIR